MLVVLKNLRTNSDIYIYIPAVLKKSKKQSNILLLNCWFFAVYFMKSTSSLRFSGIKKNQKKRFFDSEKLQNTKPKGFLILKIFRKPGNQRLFNFQTNDRPPNTGILPSAGRKASQYPSVWVVLSNPNVLVVHTNEL